MVCVDEGPIVIERELCLLRARVEAYAEDITLLKAVATPRDQSEVAVVTLEAVESPGLP